MSEDDRISARLNGHNQRAQEALQSKQEETELLSKYGNNHFEGHSKRIKANVVLNEPCFLNLYRRCIDIGRGILGLFSARARERATDFWLIVEGGRKKQKNPNPTTKLN